MTELDDHARLCRLGDLTLIAYLRYLAAYGGASSDEDGLFLFAGPHRQPNPYRNGALLHGGALSAEEALARADRFFADRGSGYALWVPEHGDGNLEAAAQAAGWRELERVPEMIMTELPAPVPLPDGVELCLADTPQRREDYLRVVAAAWGMGNLPRDVAARVFFQPDSLADPAAVPYMAYHEGRAISASMGHLSHGQALGCQGGTVPRPLPQRRDRSTAPSTSRSLASTCHLAALEHAYRECGATFSMCQTSHAGRPIWEALGYRPFSSYSRYLVPPPAPR